MFLSPNPELELNSFDFDLMYGSPILSIISSGIPGPSSFISNFYYFIITL